LILKLFYSLSKVLYIPILKIVVGSNEVYTMREEKREKDYAKRIRELMKRRHIQDEDRYLRYLEEQKEIKLRNADARREEAEFELMVIRKMRRGEL